MSFRPTVSVFVDDQFVDWVFLPETFGGRLLEWPSYLVALLDGCDAPEEAAQRMGSKWPADERDLHGYGEGGQYYPGLLDITEYPLLVDVTRRCIYVSGLPLSTQRVQALSPLGERAGWADFHDELPLGDDERIPFSMLQLGEIRELATYAEYVGWLRRRGSEAS